MPGDEVITAAVGFPTTIAPAYQHGLVPVYVDVEPDTYNPSLEAIAAAIGPRTRGLVLAHTLGNPFDGPGVEALCREHDLVLIEDCCDALGTRIGGRLAGTFGAAATYSFYPAHHMTTGEGGAVACDDAVWHRALGSLREWGRDCWCPPGVDGICGRRFDGRYGDLPEGYDHKYVFSHVGFNFKVTDMQAALGVAQLDRLDGFHRRRRENAAHLAAAFAPYADRLVLPARPAGRRPVVVRLPAHAARRRRRPPPAAAGVPARAPDRHAPAARGQPRPPARLPGPRAPRRRPAAARRPHHRGGAVGRLLARADAPEMLDWIVDVGRARSSPRLATLEQHERPEARGLAVGAGQVVVQQRHAARRARPAFGSGAAVTGDVSRTTTRGRARSRSATISRCTGADVTTPGASMS